jgi:hypothetical protein
MPIQFYEAVRLIMTSSITRFAFYLTLFVFLILPTAVSAQEMGPLTRSASNPNYFARPDGTPVYFVGSHQWSNLIDGGPTFPPAAFNYAAYIDWMQRNKFNFMRMWAWEHPYGASWGFTHDWYFDPLPYARTGPGLAADGRPKFNLNSLNQAYFDRLRARVIAARERGIYVSIMLYQGFSVDSKGVPTNPWPYHPFNISNNINNINGDPFNTGLGLTHTTSASAAVLNAQKAYVRKVVDTVNDLDNALYEISNESHPNSAQWQYDLINYIKSYEAGKPQQHPVGITGMWSPEADRSNSPLFNSPADWLSPLAVDNYIDDPPANNGSNVVITDTDHLWGLGGDTWWVWRSFARGLNPIFMDDLFGDTRINPTVYFPPGSLDPSSYAVRTAMTQTANYAVRMNLRAAKPNGGLSSTGFMLADPGTQYLIFAPYPGNFTVNLSAGSGSSFSVEWFDVFAGTTTVGPSIVGGSSAQAFTPPFWGAGALFLNKII